MSITYFNSRGTDWISFISIIIEEIQILSSIQLDEIESFLALLTNEVNKKFSSYNINFKLDFKSLINNLNISSISDVFQSMFEILGNIFLAIFSDSFHCILLD